LPVRQPLGAVLKVAVSVILEAMLAIPQKKLLSFHNGQLQPDPILFRVGTPFITDNLAFAPHTFVYRLPNNKVPS